LTENHFPWQKPPGSAELQLGIFFSFSAELELGVPVNVKERVLYARRGDWLAGFYAEHSIQNASVRQAFALLDQLISCVFQIPGRMTGLMLHKALRTKVPFALVVEVPLIIEDA
jgi:hypothetical protein